MEEEPIQFKKKGIARPDRASLTPVYFAFTAADTVTVVVDNSDQLALSINPDMITDKPKSESKSKQKVHNEEASVSRRYSH